MEEDIETCGWFVFYKDQLLIEKKNGINAPNVVRKFIRASLLPSLY